MQGPYMPRSIANVIVQDSGLTWEEALELLVAEDLPAAKPDHVT
jgi:hypothetical protein